MERSGRRRATGAACFVKNPGSLLAATCALVLAGCNPDKQAVSAAQPRGATVAFESVDGLPPGQFRKVVQDLNDEAQSRRLAVISREQSSAYRVRGYFAVKVMKHQTTVTWVWDVFDQDEHRALRISGEEMKKVRHRDAWAAADDAMLSRIARESMEQLALFLTSPEVAPGTAPSSTEPQVAMTNRERVLTRGRRDIPHFPCPGRPGFNGCGRCCCRQHARRAGAASTPPPGRDAVDAGYPDDGGHKPLMGDSSYW